MNKELVVWQIDREKFHKKVSYIVFGLLSLAFFILPQFGIDKLEFILQVERIIGLIHPSILKVYDLPNFGSRAALLILFANFIFVYYLFHAFIVFSHYAKTKKTITFLQKLKGLFLVSFSVVLAYFLIFFHFGYRGTLTITKSLNSSELFFFFLSSSFLMALIFF